MRINFFFIIAILYFFFNSLFLPIGLLYTAILSPLFYVWLLLKKKYLVIFKFLLVLSPFIIAHYTGGVIIEDYIITLISLFTVYIFIYTIYLFLETRNYLAQFFRKITTFNFILSILALIILLLEVEDIWHVLWNWSSISTNVEKLPRLQLFTYEPSYYSTLLVPLIFYFSLRSLLNRNNEDLKYLGMVLVPLLFSFSLGVMGAIVISFLLVLLFNLHKLSIKRKYLWLFLSFCVLLLFGALVLWIVYPENPLYLRINNLIMGTDTSGRGRTSDAFEIAMLLLEQEDKWLFGVGLGQIKTIGYELIVNYYHYQRETVKTVAIPNAFAETLAIFGIIGASLRLLIQVFLFFKTKVYNNYFQSLCFTFIFIYQFTGSYITNIAEYSIWLLAFVPYFTQFDKQHYNRLDKQSIERTT